MHLLRALAASLAIAAAATPLAARAEAPMQKTQPGWQRTMVGDFEVTVLSDGTVRLPMLQLLRGDPARLKAALERGFLGEQVETSVNGFLVNTGRDAYGANDRALPDDWWPGYNVFLGAARGERYLVNGVFRRDFERGVVLVNQPGSPQATVELGETLTDLAHALSRPPARDPALALAA